MKAERLEKADLAKLPTKYRSYASVHPYLLPIFGRMYWRRLDYCLTLLSKYLPSDPTCIVDLGAGVGIFLRSLHAQFPQTRLAGLDIYPHEVLHAARQAWFQDGAVQLSRGDIHRLPFSDASLDAVTALDVLEHVVDPEMALMEIHRVLRSGGSFLVSVPTEGVFLRAARRTYFLGRQHEMGAHPHWEGTVRNFTEFWETACSHFKVLEGAYVPFRFGGPRLNYDYIALCHPTGP